MTGEVQTVREGKKSFPCTPLILSDLILFISTWRYPKMNLQEMLTIWFLGIPTQQVPPLKLMTPLDLAHCNKQQACKTIEI